MKKTRHGLALAESRGHWLPPCLLPGLHLVNKRRLFASRAASCQSSA
jgi:hypothetical protein